MIEIIDYKSASGSQRHIHKIYAATPYSDYLLLKEDYRMQDETVLDKKPWKSEQLKFNTQFLRRMERQTKGNLVCVFCGEQHLKIYNWYDSKKNYKIMATCDHFYPKSKGGGAFDTNNCVVACSSCNVKKGNDILDVNSLKFLNHYPNHEQILSNLISIFNKLYIK